MINQRVLAKQLRSAKCTVTIANHGQECLDLLQRSNCWRDSSLATNDRIQVEAIILDWEMPVMNGLDCCRKIRELEATGQLTRHIPVILTTANVRLEQREHAEQAGVDFVLPKPFTVNDLLDKVWTMLNHEREECATMMVA